MRYEVIVPIKAKTSEGIQEIEAGAIVTIPETAAQRLLEGGVCRGFVPDVVACARITAESVDFYDKIKGLYL